MDDVEAVDVAVAGPAEVDELTVCGVATPTGSGRTRKSLLSNLNVWPVVVVVEAQLGRVAGEDEVLAVVVGDERFLGRSLNVFSTLLVSFSCQYW